MLREELGDVLARDLAGAAQHIGVALHVRGSDTRRLPGTQPHGRRREQRAGWRIGEMLEAGQLLQFCRRDPDSARADLRRTLRDLKARAPKARGALYHACVGRGPHLFGPDSGELRILREELRRPAAGRSVLQRRDRRQPAVRLYGRIDAIPLNPCAPNMMCHHHAAAEAAQRTQRRRGRKGIRFQYGPLRPLRLCVLCVLCVFLPER
ncbi:MAG: FIST C-terminal domain-containing protein [Chromatiales bacterium]|nr:FIST C-terminal domain-containing protein [Chromatiales bacterium]